MKNFKVKCVEAVGSWFTVGKIYDVINGCFYDNHGDKYAPFYDVDDINNNCASKFELYTEEEKMENFKVRCVDGYSDLYTKGKIYEVVGGNITNDKGIKRGNFTSVDEINYALIPQFELVTIHNNGLYGIEKVIFNSPATIVLWSDGTKTVVKAEYEDFDPEKGLAMAISKKALGNRGSYYDVFKKWLPEEDEEDLLTKLGKAISDGFSQVSGKIEMKEKQKKNEDTNVTGELKPSGVKVTISEKRCNNCKYQHDLFSSCVKRNCYRVFTNSHYHVDAWEPKEKK